MSSEGRPNPITKAAESSNLPREARARLGLNTDPVPEGKIIDAAPEHYHKITPEVRDGEKSQEGDEEEDGPDAVARAGFQKEMNKMQAEQVKNQGKNQAGSPGHQVYHNAGQMRMDSRGGAQNFQGSKQMDSVYKSQ
ncbi:hypothetical protein F751_3397 [Auxenochlorella protothecoides]|uniref:Uncharacterized protein n=1 Tax=Auxenochlorella protothecoides TaxID=3075 RepID=A0A087SBV2_AUXPR|nr:hypothetical protein F751_3397 [Auxenochlorella protothecoides]KFM23206.1 hypothetical protein F751_3397 [Auxenochlorella protothecoides]RMZ53591.1 hypothetical protein APUTEX25_003413 [Auxenochlorella protothecoides]|eukprot:RMZ53591.1 hypothetical protein APUTEX25_003413 [Auxenochlorella protothecoides]